MLNLDYKLDQRDLNLLMDSEKNKWVLPKSPIGMLQEDLWPDEWKVLIACLLHNLTTRKQVDKVYKILFDKYPDPESMSKAHETDLYDIVKPLGLWKKRSATLIRFSKEYLEKGKIQSFGDLMHEHGEHKKRRSAGMSNSQIDAWYELARKNGAIGGKLVGAGGGGFLMLLTEDRTRLRQTMEQAGLEEVRFRFDFEGTKIILSS